MSASIEMVSVVEAERPLFGGIDIGGTNIKLGLVDNRGRCLGKTSIPTHADDGPDAAVARISAALPQLSRKSGVDWAEVCCLGLGSPGTMDIPRGILLEPPNLPTWWNFPIKERIAAECSRRVAFANDANAAAYGEFWVGRGREYHSIIVLTLGTGVGGGIIIGDLSIDGENSHGSECGHIIIDYHDSARVCSCGKRGHLEAYASATALRKRAEEAVQSGRPTSLARRANLGEELSPLVIAAEADAGDELSLELILETGYYLGVGISSLIHTIDPAAVILGGGMTFGGEDARLGHLFLNRIREEVRARCFPVPAQRTNIHFASLGGDAGFIGAAGIARLAYQRPRPV